jgi:predicted naringenin-chalcone synthase
MGCHGAFNGLRVAQAFTEANPEARVLLSTVELCSLHFHFGWDPEKVVANGLFADGAAALVAGSSTTLSPPLSHQGRGSVENPLPLRLPSEALAKEGERARVRGSWKLLNTGSFLFPDSEETMTWKIGNYGFEMTLSARVPALIKNHLRPWLTHWLLENQLRLSDIRSWAIHPGGPRILDTVRETLDLPPQATAVSEKILSQYGNMSSATVLFILKQLRDQNASRPCVALGFGPGLALEAALFAP